MFKNISALLIALLLFSCSSIDEAFIIESDIDKNGNAEQILSLLDDAETRKGKIFIYSNTQDGLTHFVRVNDDEIFMRDREVQVVDLLEGDNNIYTFNTIFGDEVGNCSQEAYTFNTKNFPDFQTHYFMIFQPAAKEIAGRMFICYKEAHLIEEAFFYFLDYPKSRWNKNWLLN